MSDPVRVSDESLRGHAASSRFLDVKAMALELLERRAADSPERTPMSDLPTWSALEEKAAAELLCLARTHDGQMVTMKCAGGPGLHLCLTISNLTHGDTDQIVRAAVYAVIREIGVLG